MTLRYPPVRFGANEAEQLAAIAECGPTELGKLISKDAERNLRELGLVERDGQGLAILTPAGRECAAGVVWRDRQGGRGDG